MPIIVTSLGTSEKDVLNRNLDAIKVLVEMGENAVYEQMKSMLTHYTEEDKLSFD